MLTSRRTVVAALASLTALLAPLPALAGGYAVPNANARDLALSSAAVAAQTGPEALYQNPAALAGQEGLGISVSLMGLYNTTTWSDPNLGTASLDPKLNTPPAAAITYSGKTSGGIGYGFGAGFGVMGGGSLNWPPNWPGNQKVVSVTEQVYVGQVGFAVAPTSFLKLGATALYYRMTQDLTQKLGVGTNLWDAELGLAGGSLSYGASVQVDVPGVPLSLAVNYRHQAVVDLRGNAHFAGVPPTFQAQALLQDQGVSARHTVPNEVYVGASYMFPAKVQLMAAWSMERWSVYTQDHFVGDLGFTVTVPRNFNDAYVIRAGVEWSELFGTGLTLRVGGLRSISQQPTDTISPSLTDASSWGGSVGIGYQIVRWLRVDLAYQHVAFDDVTATGSETLNGTYQTKVELASVGLTFRL
jgi:long-chain fatty acid transport protein